MDDKPFYINMWNFIKKVIIDSRAFINRGAGRPADAFSFDDVLSILAIIIFVILLATKFGRRTIKRYFDPKEPDEEYYEKDKSYRGKIKVEGLEQYEPLFDNLAKKAGINEVVFRYNSDVIIHSIEQSGYVSVIEIGDGFLDRLSRIRNTAARNQFFSFAVSHELIHIKYHDPMNITWLNITSVILWLDGLILIGLIPLLLIPHPSLFFMGLHFSCIIFWFCFITVIPRQSYWSHCAEYRADREALILNRANVDVIFTAFSRCFPEMKDKHKVGVNDMVKNLWNALTGKAATLDTYAHPSLSQRRQEAQRKLKAEYSQQEQKTEQAKKTEQDCEKKYIAEEKWCIADYFRVAILFIIALIKGERQYEN